MSTTNRYLGVDPMLTNVAIGYSNDAYIAGDLFPTLPVNTQTGKHFIYNQERFVSPSNKARRAAGANSDEVTHSLTTGLPYICEDHALKEFVTDEDMESAITPTSPMVDATENVMERHYVSREVELAASLTSTAV